MSSLKPGEALACRLGLLLKRHRSRVRTVPPRIFARGVKARTSGWLQKAATRIFYGKSKKCHGLSFESDMARKYSRKSQSYVKKEMHEMKRGKLKSGRSHKRVTNPKQAIAIGLSEARKHGAKVPKKRSSSAKKH